MESQPESETWSSNLAYRVGQQVRRSRDLQGLSAQQLADRTIDLGHPLTRSTIAGLESGRRGTVTLADVLVLAYALDVSPVMLVFPVAVFPDLQLDLLPGMTVPLLDAADWWSGEIAQPVNGGDDAERARTWVIQLRPLLFSRQLRRSLNEWAAQTAAAGNAQDEAVAVLHRQWARSAAQSARDMYRHLLEDGMTPEPLPPKLLADASDAP